MPSAKSKTTLSRISDGLYVVRGTGIRVADDELLNRFHPNRTPEDRWSVTWKDWMSTEHTRRFPTLRAARDYIRSTTGANP